MHQQTEINLKRVYVPLSGHFAHSNLPVPVKHFPVLSCYNTFILFMFGSIL